MPKKIFWPIALTIMGFILLGSNLGLLPHSFYNLWPIILIVVGLGGLLTSDRDEWLRQPSKSTSKKKKRKKASKKKSLKK